MIEKIVLSFIPLFVAVDAIGVLPIFINFTHTMSKKERKKVIISSVVTALSLSISFILLGRFIFNILGITINDFLIAGGSILFSLSILDILTPNKQKKISSNELAIVPIGTPLIAGPAVLTTSLIMLDLYGIIPTLVSVITNILFAGIIFSFSNLIIKITGEAGAKAISKITSLLLAAISIMMIRKGIFGIINSL